MGQNLALSRGLIYSVLALGISSRYKREMRILMLLSQTEITGAEVHAAQLGEWLLGRGHQVYLISDTLNVKTAVPYVPRSIHPKGFFNRILNIIFLRKFIQDQKIDILHAHSRAAVRVGFWACLFSRAILVSTIHGRQHFSFSKKIFNLYGRHIISVCKNIQRHLENDFGISKNLITVIGNPVLTAPPILATISFSAPIAIVGRTSGPKGEQTKKIIREVLPKVLAQIPTLKIHLLGGPLETLGPETLHQIAELNLKYPGCIEAVTPVKLDEALINYRLIFGAGRVAIAALFRGVPVWAIGEHSSLGFITAQNFEKSCESNFGDIGTSSKAIPFDPEDMLKKLIQFLNISNSKESERNFLRQMTLRHFDFNKTAAKIEAIYKAALLYKHHPHHIPILMYHMVIPTAIETKHRIFVTTAQFEAQLALYKKWGYQTLNFQDVQDFTCGQKPWSLFPKKPFFLTFDDGYTNNLTEALPLLKKYDFKAVIYLLAENDLKNNHWDEGEIPLQPLMNAEQRQQLYRSGSFEIGSHGLHHKPLTEMSADEAIEQLSKSKTLLEKEFGTSILSYAFTYGLRNDELADEAFSCGYNYIINTDQGGFHLSQPVTSIFRTPIFPQDAGFKLWRKVKPWYRRYFYFTRKK